MDTFLLWGGVTSVSAVKMLVATTKQNCALQTYLVSGSFNFLRLKFFTVKHPESPTVVTCHLCR